MARREFINFPASQLMTDFEIIYLGQDIIQYNEANQNQDDVIILPIQDLQIMEETRVGIPYVPVPNIPEDNPKANVRHISFNIEQIDEHSKRDTLDLSLNEQINEHPEEDILNLSLNSTNSSVFEQLIEHENNHDSSGTIQDNSSNDSTPENSNEDSFKSMLESPKDTTTLNSTPELEQDEI